MAAHTVVAGNVGMVSCIPVFLFCSLCEINWFSAFLQFVPSRHDRLDCNHHCYRCFDPFHSRGEWLSIFKVELLVLPPATSQSTDLWNMWWLSLHQSWPAMPFGPWRDSADGYGWWLVTSTQEVNDNSRMNTLQACGLYLLTIYLLLLLSMTPTNPYTMVSTIVRCCW